MMIVLIFPHQRCPLKRIVTIAIEAKQCGTVVTDMGVHHGVMGHL